MRVPLPTYQVDAAVLKLHARRCTCLQFHPTNDNLVLSGDKHGQVPALTPFLLSVGSSASLIDGSLFWCNMNIRR